MPARRRTQPGLDALHGQEHFAVLADLLAAHPELQTEAERAARSLLEHATTETVAEQVAGAVENIPLENLAARCGRVPGRGYVHENEAAWELLEEALEPFMADLRRRANMGLVKAAIAISTGIVAGLYDAREAVDGTVVAYAGPDAPIELAHVVLAETAELGVRLPADAADRWPAWKTLA